MRIRYAMGGLALVAATLVWRAPGDVRATRLDPPPPERAGDLELMDLPPLSFVDVPLQIDVRALVALLDRRLPRQWTAPDVTVGDDGRSAAMSFTRGPLAGSMQGDVARLSATATYALRTSYELPLLPDIPLSCGTDDGPAPRVDLHLEAPVTVSDDWRLVTRSRVAGVEPSSDLERDRCQVTVLGVDVTDRVTDGIATFISGRTTWIDSLAADLDLRPQFEAWWELLSAPIRLDRDSWLLLHPATIGRGSVSGEGSTVEVVARLGIRPAILVGAPPDPDPVPLPRITESADEGPFSATLDVRVGYEELNEILARETGPIELTGAGRRIEVERVEVFGVGGGQLAVDVEVSGDVRGTLYLVGTPEYDPLQGVVRLPDLALTVRTSDLLIAAASWILDSGIERMMQERVRWPVAEVLAWGEGRMRVGLNARLSEAARLSGDVGSLEILEILAHSEALMVRASAEGNVELIVESAR